jgi:hypothetical protein
MCSHPTNTIIAENQQELRKEPATDAQIRKLYFATQGFKDKLGINGTIGWFQTWAQKNFSMEDCYQFINALENGNVEVAKAVLTENNYQ